MNSLLGKKVGMTKVFDESGNQIGVTVVEAGPCVVTRVKTVESDGYDAVQLGLGNKKREVRLANPKDYKAGQEIKVDIFKSGEHVNVSGISIGKGFAGRIKRFHQSRGPMTHGSKCHRLPGSIGSGTTPGRVWKGKNMPGRLGGIQATVKNLKVVQVIPEKNLLLLGGSVPGKRGNLVRVWKRSLVKS